MFTKADVEKYFVSEKNISLLFIIIGALAIITALLFFFCLKKDFYKGAAIPLLLIGLLQLIASIYVYNRSDAQRKDIIYKLDMNFATIKQSEIPRIEKVVKRFIVYRWVEIALFFAGIVLVIMYKNNTEKSFWIGLGLTLALQAAITFGADSFANKKANNYLEGLKIYKPQSMHL